MIRVRLIPSLLLENRRLVKTKKFKDPTYIGDPINAIKIFNEKEVDEILILDRTSTLLNKPPDFEYLQDLAGEAFVPLSYGGGIKNIDDARKLFQIGFEKVVVRSEHIKNPQFISELSKCFGSSSVVAAIDLKKTWFGHYDVVDASRKKVRDQSWPNVLKTLEQLGAGEVLIQSIDRDGTLAGPDMALVKEIAHTEIPIIYAGGVSSNQEICEVLEAGVDAVGIGAFCVFHGPHRAVLITYPSRNELSKLMRVE